MAKSSSSSMNEGQFASYMADQFDRQQNQLAYPNHDKGFSPVPKSLPSPYQQRSLSPEAQQYFARPSNKCQVCGGSMEPFRDPKWADWERKWSVHRPCAESVYNQLDRKTGITSERQR